jgi:hypothetical protein
MKEMEERERNAYKMLPQDEEPILAIMPEEEAADKRLAAIMGDIDSFQTKYKAQENEKEQ